jgi:hypothetical protein
LYVFFNISNFSVGVFFNFTQSFITALCPIAKKSNFTKNNCNPHMHQPNKLKFSHHINKCFLQLFPFIPNWQHW